MHAQLIGAYYKNIKVITFDSPGVKEMLPFEMQQHRYDNITNYVMPANAVNRCNTRLGKTHHLSPHLTDRKKMEAQHIHEFQGEVPPLHHVFDYHGISYFMTVFKANPEIYYRRMNGKEEASTQSQRSNKKTTQPSQSFAKLTKVGSEFKGGTTLKGFHGLVHKMMMVNELRSGSGAYQLSDAKKGKSGYSFGGNQMDLAADKHACLLFSDILQNSSVPNREHLKQRMDAILEIVKTPGKKLTQEDLDLANMALKSDYGRQKIDAAYREEIPKRVEMVEKMINSVEDPSLKKALDTPPNKLILVDFCNQFGPPKLMTEYLTKGEVTFESGKKAILSKGVTAESIPNEILKFLLSTKYAEKPEGRDDIYRRHQNINNLVKKETARDISKGAYAIISTPDSTKFPESSPSTNKPTEQHRKPVPKILPKEEFLLLVNPPNVDKKSVETPVWSEKDFPLLTPENSGKASKNDKKIERPTSGNNSRNAIKQDSIPKQTDHGKTGNNSRNESKKSQTTNSANNTRAPRSSPTLSPSTKDNTSLPEKNQNGNKNDKSQLNNSPSNFDQSLPSKQPNSNPDTTVPTALPPPNPNYAVYVGIGDGSVENPKLGANYNDQKGFYYHSDVVDNNFNLNINPVNPSRSTLTFTKRMGTAGDWLQGTAIGIGVFLLAISVDKFNDWQRDRKLTPEQKETKVKNQIFQNIADKAWNYESLHTIGKEIKKIGDPKLEACFQYLQDNDPDGLKNIFNQRRGLDFKPVPGLVQNLYYAKISQLAKDAHQNLIKGNFKAANKLADQLIKTNENKPYAYYLKAQANEVTDPDHANDYYNFSVNASTSSQERQAYREAQLLFNMRHYEYRRPQDFPRQFTETVESASFDFNLGLMRESKKLKYYDVVGQVSEKVRYKLNQKIADSQTTEQDKFTAHFQCGLIHEEEGNQEAATARYAHAATHTAPTGDNALECANYLYQAGQYQKVIDCLKKNFGAQNKNSKVEYLWNDCEEKIAKQEEEQKAAAESSLRKEEKKR